jgi:hypothetical protein
MNSPALGRAGRLLRRALLLSLLAESAATLRAADGAGFLVPAFRGSPDSESALWKTFTDAEGLPGNAPNSVAPGGIVLADALVTQDVPGIAFLTGGGNIYSFSGATQFTLSDATTYTAGLGLVVFQTETLGTELDYAGVALTYNLGGGPVSLTSSRTETFRTPLGGFGGSSVGSLWQWDLSGLGVNSFTINFDAAGSSLSLDAVALDTVATPVPEPATTGLVTAGVLGGLAWLRRRHRHA